MKRNDILCPVCNESTYTRIVLLKDQPLSNLSLSMDKDEALTTQSYDIDICKCNRCSHVYNRLASLKNISYKQEANATYYTSDVWKKYTVDLAKDFIDKYDITDSNVLEIGSGDGVFLDQFQKNDNYCIGYEPSFPESEKIKYDFKVVSDYFYPSKDLDRNYDVIILRHIVEHLESAKDFLSTLVDSIVNMNSNTKIFIEVPNIKPTLDECRTNDFVYEHISYFSFYSLNYLLHSLNLEVLDSYSTFSNENIVAICSINEEYKENLQSIASSSKGFDLNIRAIKQDYQNIVNNSNVICIWGAGGRGSSFLNIIKNELTGSELLVDSDQRKFGKYVPIVGLEITDYKSLRNISIDSLVITTSLGRDNILLEIKNNKIKIKKVYVVSMDGLKQY